MSVLINRYKSSYIVSKMIRIFFREIIIWISTI